MRIPLAVLALVVLLLGVFWLLRPAPDPDALRQRDDLPWQVQALPNGRSRVFGLELGGSTLSDAIDRFGPYEELVLFAGGEGHHSLEAWFGNVQFGPLKAKVAVSLEADPSELRALAERAVERKGSPTGDWKLFLRPDDRRAQRERILAGITYIPAYTGLEADFFRQRLGEPAAWKTLEKGGVQWFYPSRGLSLLLNPKGKEVLEYVTPARFELPVDSQKD